MKNEHQHSLICMLVLLLFFLVFFFYSNSHSFGNSCCMKKKMHTYICHGLIDSHSYSIDVKPLDIREDWNKDIIGSSWCEEKESGRRTYMHTATRRGNRRCIRRMHPSLASGGSFDTLAIAALALDHPIRATNFIACKNKNSFFSLRNHK